MELTIALLFFAITAAVCLQVFAKAHLINQETEQLTTAHTIAVNLAEDYRATLLSSYDFNNKDSITLFFDDNGQIVSDKSVTTSSAPYFAVISPIPSAESTLTSIQIELHSGEDMHIIYTLPVTTSNRTQEVQS